MPVFRRTLAILALSVCVAPTVAYGAVIQCMQPTDPGCQVIGEFAWSRDNFFGLGDILVLNNFTASTALEGAFTDISLTVSAEADPRHLFSGTTLDAGGLSLETAAARLFDIESALLTFTFQNAAFSASLFATDLLDDGSGSAFGSALIYAEDVPAPVPEPSTLLLLGSGVLIAKFSRRRRKGL